MTQPLSACPFCDEPPQTRRYHNADPDVRCVDHTDWMRPEEWNTRAPTIERVTEAEARKAFLIAWKSESHRLKYSPDHPAFLAGYEMWLAAAKWAGKIGEKA